MFGYLKYIPVIVLKEFSMCSIVKMQFNTRNPERCTAIIWKLFLPKKAISPEQKNLLLFDSALDIDITSNIPDKLRMNDKFLPAPFP